MSRFRLSALAVLFLVALAATSTTRLSAQMPPAPVKVSQVVELKDAAAGHTFVGSIAPARRSTVGAAVGGRIMEFPQNAGDAVKKGDKLAQLLTKALEIQRDAAQAEVQLRRDELLELTNGALPEEKEQAAALVEMARAADDYAGKKLDRTLALAKRGAANDDQVQADRSSAIKAKKELDAALASQKLVEKGPRAEKISQANARLEMAVQEVNRLEDQLVKHTIIAPFDGYVVREFTEVGQWISPGEPVAEVIDVHEVEIEVSVLESYIPNLTIGTQARVDIGAIADRTFIGGVTKIIPQADAKSRSFPVIVRLQNEVQEDGTPLFKPGMGANLTLPVKRKSTINVVSKDALVLGGNSPVIYVCKPGKNADEASVVRVPVELGIAIGGRVEIRGDIAAGDWVVTEGNERLLPNQQVKIVERLEEKVGHENSDTSNTKKQTAVEPHVDGQDQVVSTRGKTESAPPRPEK